MILGAFLKSEGVFWRCWWGSFAKDGFGASFGLDFEVFGWRIEFSSPLAMFLGGGWKPKAKNSKCYELGRRRGVRL